MKGLLYKEFFLGRKTYLGFFSLFFVFALLCILICLSMICGNLQGFAVKDPESAKLIAILSIYMPYAILLAGVWEGSLSVYRDYDCGFTGFGYTLPVKTELLVGACYLKECIYMVLAMGLGLINAGIVCAITNVRFDAGILKNTVVILLLAVVAYAWELPLAYKFKNPRAVNGITVLICVAGYLVAGGVFISRLDEITAFTEAGNESVLQHFFLEKYVAIRDTAFGAIPFLIVVLLSISFLISVQICKRRER